MIRSKSKVRRLLRKLINILYRNNINKLMHIGENTYIAKDCYFGSPENIYIGNNVIINNQCWFIGSGGIEIKDNVLIGPRVSFYSSNHNYKDKNKLIREQGYVFKKITVENDVWIGSGAIILNGVTLGEGCVVAAGAIVTKDVEHYTVVGGVPAKKITVRE
ncbi:acyltransferase [Desulforamulus ruminis]|uniref:acyltransferase n=1 Tax=Desulforamulus ruminis TaxID=1564 RepID=UPI0023570B66|nr:acyltransferase [Desulforamulus ruminis]